MTITPALPLSAEDLDILDASVQQSQEWAPRSGVTTISFRDFNDLIDQARAAITLRYQLAEAEQRGIEAAIRHVAFMDLSDTDNEYVAFRLKELLPTREPAHD